MFDSTDGANGALEVAALSRLCAALGGLAQDVAAGVRIDRIRVLEQVKGAVAAAQARETAAFAAAQRAEQAAAGVPAERVGRGVAGQVGLARRISPHAAARYTGWAAILSTELPRTFAVLAAGETSEWRALLVAKETVFLSAEHRRMVDAEVAPRLPGWGDRAVEAATRALAYRLDPAGFVKRAGAAAGDRRVSLRPAPDVMCRLTAMLPAAQGVAAYAALCRQADSRIGAGDGRGRGQVMADTLVERVTGQATASDVPVEVNLIMTDTALFGGGDAAGGSVPGAAAGDPTAGELGAGTAADGGVDEPAYVDGYGPVPAEVARRLIVGPGAGVPRWLRRLYLHPATGALVAVESRRRCFTAAQRRFIRLRDRTCRTPWCDAPIRHTDHITPHQDGGATSIDNAQGYCVACNHAKQAPGWRTTLTSTGPAPHRVLITTPTGHHYPSTAPPPPRPAPRARARAPVDQRPA